MGYLSDEMLLAAISVALSVILFTLVFVLLAKMRSMQSKYLKMLNQTGVDNLQDIIIDIQQRINALQASGKEFDSAIRSIRERLGSVKGNVAIHRYNAFNERGTGSDLSFSVAILDDGMNGVVFTGIHGREETYMYGKPIVKGDSKYTLSPEEKQAVHLALNKTAESI